MRRHLVILETIHLCRTDVIKIVVYKTHSYNGDSNLLGDHGTGSGRLVLPVGGKFTGGSVITSQTVDTRLN
jgi:hypothetical protein